MASVYRGARSASGLSFMFIAIAAATWGSEGFFRRRLALELPSGTIVMVEHLILVLLTLPWLIRALPITKSFSRRDWISLVLIGAGASALATVLFTQAFAYGDPTTPLLLQKLQPLFAIIGAALLLGERVLPRFGLYFIAAVGGAWLITFPEPTNVSVSAFTPAAFALGAAGLWGLGTVLGRHLTTKMEFAPLTALRFAVGLPATILIVVVQDQGEAISTIGGKDAFALLLLALVPGLLALMLYYRGLRETPASAATLAELAFPLSAITINYIAFEEQLVRSQWVGVVVLSLAIVAMGLAATRGSRALGVNLPPTVRDEPAHA
ncbi:MAG TPA: EamA family transporter [Actinomycetota bacterium]|nr:EamA family transporter [Actinomycetota bacterium]